MPHFTLRIAPTLVAVLFLATAGISQQTSGNKSKVPVMSSDDLDASASTTSRSVASPGAGSPAAMKRYLVEGCGLSIALPGEPIGFDGSQVIGDAGDAGDSKYYLSKGSGYSVVIIHTFDRRAFSVEAYVAGMLAAYGEGNSDLKYSFSEKSKTRAAVGGSYNKNGKQFGFEILTQLKEHHLWVIISMWPLSHDAREAVKAVLESSSFDVPSCPN
jgi:hypothetical protein